MKPVAFSYLVLRCADLAASCVFYEALGLVFVEEQHGKGPRHLSCDLGGVVLELYPRGKRSTRDVRFGFRLDDPQAALARLAAAGYANPSSGSFVIHDPDGHTIELMS